MDREELAALPIEELLRRTQTNVTPDPVDGFEIAKIAYGLAETPIELGTAARQAGFRAEQADRLSSEVGHWFFKSRTALESDDPAIQRELIATNLLHGRAMALRTERLGEYAIAEVALASSAFAGGERILQEQHRRGSTWDRFGTMLARHRATHEAMNGDASFAAATAARGLWRAIRAEKESTLREHKSFVVKQLGVNAAAGVLAITRPMARITRVATARHHLARKLLG